jgi:hypothetical protein
MIQFKLSETEEKIFNEWKKNHLEVVHKDGRVYDSFGAWVKFSFVPSGLGDSPSAECLCCHEKFQIVDPDWEP